MVNNVLSLLRPELALNMHSTDFACGTYVGYGFTLKGMNEKSCFVFNSWVRPSALTSLDAESYFKQIMTLPENSFIKAYRVSGSNVSAVLFVNADEKQAVTDVKRFITELVKYYSSNHYSNSCAKCGSSVGLSFGQGSDGSIRQYCKMCMQTSDFDQASVAAVQNNSFVQPSVQPVEQPQQPQTVGVYGIPVSAETPVPPVQQVQPYVQQPQNTGVYGIPGNVGATVQPVENTVNPVNPYMPQSGNTYPNADSYVGQQMSDNINMPSPNNGFTQQPQQPQNVGMYGIPAPDTANFMPVPPSDSSMDSIDPMTAPSSTGYSTAESLAELPPPSNPKVQPVSGGFAPMNNGYVQQPMNSGFNDTRFIAGRPTAVAPEGNPILGILGAVLFSFIGCAIWVIIGKLGFISYLGGIAMSFSTLFGYNLLGKKFDIIGLITGFLITFLMVLFANMIICSWGCVSDPDISSEL